MAARKILKKQKDKSYIPKEFSWNPFIVLDNKAKKIPKSLIFALLFCLVSFSFLFVENQKINQKVLGAKIQLEADQKTAYEWEQILVEKPDYRDGWLQLSAIYAKMGNIPKAQETLNRAKAIDPNNEIIPSLEKLLGE
jgi:tetratricopeptide (TPR) repeat protein